MPKEAGGSKSENFGLKNKIQNMYNFLKLSNFTLICHCNFPENNGSKSRIKPGTYFRDQNIYGT